MMNQNSIKRSKITLDGVPISKTDTVRYLKLILDKI